MKRSLFIGLGAVAALATMIFTEVLAVTAPPQTANEREVQIRSVDFDLGIIELFNFSSADFDLSGWRFCSHDFDEARRYTSASGLNGVTIESETSVFIHFNDDAPAGDSDRVNRSDLGGGFATPLDQDAYGIQLFFPDSNGNVSFGNSSLIADHMQWNIDGDGTGQSETRTAQAVSEGLWSATGDFIATAADSTAIVLVDNSGDFFGSPDEYDVIGVPLLVVPESATVVDGTLRAGSVDDLIESDDVDLWVSRSRISVRSLVTLDIKGTSPTPSPSTFEFVVEGSVLSRRDVIQTISLFDYVSNQFEEVDARVASVSADSIAVATADGDLSRFVDPTTGCVEARIQFQGSQNRSSFAAYVDQVLWMIGN